MKLYRHSISAIALLMLIDGQSVFAQNAAGAATTQTELPETLITTQRDATSSAITPLLQLSPPELDAYGADTLSDLVDALKPLTRSSRSDQMAVVLINGHLAGQIEFQNLPREAIERVEVLPETVALQYGYSENQRVLNFILRDHYRAIPARASDSGATEGGAQTTAADASFVRLEEEARATLLASYKDAAWLRASDRNINVPDNHDLTLQPATSNTTLAGTLSRTLLGVSSSLEMSLDLDSSKSLQGAADVDSSGDSRRSLKQNIRDRTARIATQLTGKWGHFIWGATASYVRESSHSTSETGFDSHGDALADRTDSTLNAGNLQLSLSGSAAELPAGPLIANFRFGLQYQGFESERFLPGSTATRSNLIRSIRSGNFNASIPIAKRNGDAALTLGDLSGTLNVSLDNVSEFGPLWSLSYGFDWTPIEKIHLDAIVTAHESAPTVQQVLAPPIFTPNVEMFDYVTGETAYVTQTTGGGGNLQPADDRAQSFGVSLGPFGKTTLSAHYERHSVNNDIGPLPPLTADVELAFPERLTRDSAGRLIAVDNRWINRARERTDDLKWGFNVWMPLGASPSPRMPNRFEVALFDTWYLRQKILIRSGIPELDLLNGAPLDVAGGQPRHKVEFRSLLYKNGLGGALSGTWHSATQVTSGDSSASNVIFFHALATADLRLFADFERIPRARDHAWAKAARLSLSVTNLFDRRQTVRDANGVTPTAFAPGYLDPTGRTVTVSARKLF